MTRANLITPGVKTRLRQLIKRINDDEVFGRAAQLSYFFLLAIFPLLLFLVTLLGYFVQSGSDLQAKLLNYLAALMPSSAITLVRNTLDEISNSKSGGKLSLGFLAALWTASLGMGAISSTLNNAYNLKETRSWWMVRLISVVLTISLAILIIAALTIVLYGGLIGDAITNRYGLGYQFRWFWHLVQWPIALLFVLATFNLIYNFAPNVSRSQRRWITPGALVGVALWLLVSFGFRIYLHFFDSYSVTYGSLGALIVLMLWFYFTGVAILIGGEINSAAIERREQQMSSQAPDG